jgi:hypothetical protein
MPIVNQSYIEFTLCYVYVGNLVDLTPIAYSRLRYWRSVRHPSLVANPCLITLAYNHLFIFLEAFCDILGRQAE